MDVLLCPWDTSFGFIAETVPALLYYSHIPAVIAALGVGFFVFFNNRHETNTKLLLLVFVLFSVWTVIDLFLWANNRTDLTMFFWATQILVELIIYASAFYLFYHYAFRKTPTFKINLLVAILLLPTILLFPTRLILEGVTTECVAYEHPFIVYYSYITEIAFALSIIALAFVAFRKATEASEKKKILYFCLGTIVFLVSFTSGNIIGSATGHWEIAQYGLFGMPVFIAFLSYLIVRFQLFRVKILVAQALVLTLLILVGSLWFVVTAVASKVVVAITTILLIFFGFVLIRNVKNEIKQRQEIEKLAEQLQVANKRLKKLDRMKSEFVSIASHQLRSPLTSIRGYASMLLEGSYGKFPAKAHDVLENIADSSRYMALSVEDYLNVSRIESGNMKYEKSDFNLKELAETVADELRPEAIRRGLLVTFKSDVDSKAIINADIGKTKQIIQNLVDNAMKYTPKGQIQVFVHDDVKKKEIFVDVIDNGIGMSKETLAAVFDKFERAQNANDVNVTGTGLGLYIARTMARALGGDVYATSEGESKGSTFTIKMPLAM